jgi:hypothetical protein
MAIYTPRMFLEYFRRGVVRTFSYELLDESPDGNEREDNFGLLRNDLSEKPAFTALRNTIDILQDPGPAFAPETVAYTVRGDRADLHSLLLQKRDGTFYLALWRATDVWDPEAQTELDSPGGEVTLEFGRQVKSAVTYLPNASNTPVDTIPTGNGQPLAVNVAAGVTIVKLTLGKQASGRIKAWVSRRAVPAGGRVAVKGRLPSWLTGRPLRVKIQQWRGHGWKTVGRTRSTRAGAFRKKIRMTAKHAGRASRVRAVARVAKPSRPLRVRIRR